jgi:hypothetical protein
MFLGHYAVAFAAKRVAPGTSLGTLFIATQFVDLLWPLFLLLGLEHVRINPGDTVVTPLEFYDYPLTHSLAGALAWSVLLGGIYYGFRRNLKVSLIVGGLVASHWLLDLVVHRPDLPIGPGGGRALGLGLWNSLPGTLLVEFGLFAAGIAVYLSSTRAQGRAGVIGFWLLAALLPAIYVMNLLAPPPGEAAIGIAGNALWLFVIWAYWLDRHRPETVAPHLPPM